MAKKPRLDYITPGTDDFVGLDSGDDFDDQFEQSIFSGAAAATSDPLTPAPALQSISPRNRERRVAKMIEVAQVSRAEAIEMLRASPGMSPDAALEAWVAAPSHGGAGGAPPRTLYADCRCGASVPIQGRAAAMCTSCDRWICTRCGLSAHGKVPCALARELDHILAVLSAADGSRLGTVMLDDAVAWSALGCAEAFVPPAPAPPPTLPEARVLRVTHQLLHTPERRFRPRLDGPFGSVSVDEVDLSIAAVEQLISGHRVLSALRLWTTDDQTGFDSTCSVCDENRPPFDWASHPGATPVCGQCAAQWAELKVAEGRLHVQHPAGPRILEDNELAELLDQPSFQRLVAARFAADVAAAATAGGAGAAALAEFRCGVPGSGAATQRCPGCGEAVVRVAGCASMTCRCGARWHWTGGVHEHHHVQHVYQRRRREPPQPLAALCRGIGVLGGRGIGVLGEITDTMDGAVQQCRRFLDEKRTHAVALAELEPGSRAAQTVATRVAIIDAEAAPAVALLVDFCALSTDRSFRGLIARMANEKLQLMGPFALGLMRAPQPQRPFDLAVRAWVRDRNHDPRTRQVRTACLELINSGACQPPPALAALADRITRLEQIVSTVTRGGGGSTVVIGADGTDATTFAGGNGLQAAATGIWRLSPGATFNSSVTLAHARAQQLRAHHLLLAEAGAKALSPEPASTGAVVGEVERAAAPSPMSNLRGRCNELDEQLVRSATDPDSQLLHARACFVQQLCDEAEALDSGM